MMYDDVVVAIVVIITVMLTGRIVGSLDLRAYRFLEQPSFWKRESFEKLPVSGFVFD